MIIGVDKKDLQKQREQKYNEYAVLLNSKNPSKDELNALKLNELSGIALTGIITSFSGNEPFKFYMYDRFSDITPNSSPDINDLREFYSEYETSFSSY